jgi:hypothetical protein
MKEENKKEQNIEKRKINKKKLVKIVIKIALLLVGGFIFISILPFLGFIAIVLYSRFIDVPAKPKVKHGEFPFELVYEYKGEQITIKDTIVCNYDGYSWSLDGGNSRDWTCDLKNDNEYGQYYIDKENEPDLYIEVPEAPDYYMGDKEFSKENAHPLIMYIDEATGTYYQEKDKVDVVDIKIISWKPSQPLKNNIK